MDSMENNPDITDDILFLPHQKIEWRRPSEICENPQFIIKENHFSVQKGEFGDSSLLAAISILIQDSYLFSRVVSEFNCFGRNSELFLFRFWECGEWIEIAVDDRLPTIHGDLVYLQSTYKNEFWPALLEKAYAQLHGSYEALKERSVAEILVNLTGGATETIDVKEMSNNIYNLVEEGFLRNSVISCFINFKSNENDSVATTGLIEDHCYCITDNQQFTFETGNSTGSVPLLRIHDPCANDSKWNGNWSVGSKMWSFLSESMKQRIGLTLNHKGEFWMSLIDFIKLFDRLEICHLSPNYGNGKWVVKSQQLSFEDKIHVENFRSCLMETIDTGNQLQKMHFTVDDIIKQTKYKYSVMISIMQKVPVCIQISVHKVLLNERKRICHISFNDNFHNCVRLKLTSGNYEITSEYIESDKNEQFYFRIFIPIEIPIEEINSQEQELLFNFPTFNEMILPIAVDTNEDNNSKIRDNSNQTKERKKDKKMKIMKKEKILKMNNQLMRKRPVICLIM
ncbi:unnamed protein product [Diamesa serratosioi]